jgi:hypothetical protein
MLKKSSGSRLRLILACRPRPSPQAKPGGKARRRSPPSKAKAAVQYAKNLAEAQAEAKKSKKLVFVELVTKSKMLGKEFFNNAKLAGFLKTTAVPVAVTGKESAELAKKNKITAFPAVLLVALTARP